MSSIASVIVNLAANFSSTQSQLQNLIGSLGQVGGAAQGAGQHLGNLGQHAHHAGGGLEELHEYLQELGAEFAKMALEALELGGVLDVLKDSLEISATIQTTRIAMETFTGSAEETSAALEELESIAKAEALKFPEILPAAQHMMALGFSAHATEEAMKAAGNASWALGTPLESVSQRMAQMSMSGMANNRMLRTLGISAKELGTVMGVSANEVSTAFKVLSEEDRLKVLEEAMEKFGEVGKREAEGLAGHWIEMQNAWHVTFLAIGDDLSGVGIVLLNLATNFAKFISDGIKGANDLGVTIKALYQSAQYEEEQYALKHPAYTFGKELLGKILVPTHLTPESAEAKKAADDEKAKKDAELKAATEKGMVPERAKQAAPGILAGIENEIKANSELAAQKRQAAESSIAATHAENVARINMISDVVARQQAMDAENIRSAREKAEIIGAIDTAEAQRHIELLRSKAAPELAEKYAVGPTGVPDADKTARDSALVQTKLAGEIAAVRSGLALKLGTLNEGIAKTDQKSADDAAAALRKANDEHLKEEEKHQKDVLELKRAGYEAQHSLGMISDDQLLTDIKTVNAEELQVTLDAIDAREKLLPKEGMVSERRAMEDQRRSARDAANKEDLRAQTEHDRKVNEERLKNARTGLQATEQAGVQADAAARMEAERAFGMQQSHTMQQQIANLRTIGELDAHNLELKATQLRAQAALLDTEGKHADAYGLRIQAEAALNAAANKRFETQTKIDQMPSQALGQAGVHTQLDLTYAIWNANENLNRAVAQGNIPLNDQLNLRRQILEAMIAQAEAQGTIHGQITAANLRSKELLEQWKTIGPGTIYADVTGTAMNRAPQALGGALAGGLMGSHGQDIGKQVADAMKGLGKQLLGEIFTQLIEKIAAEIAVHLLHIHITGTLIATNATLIASVDALNATMIAQQGASGVSAASGIASGAGGAASAAGSAAGAAAGGLVGPLISAAGGIIGGVISGVMSLIGAHQIVRAINATTAAVNALHGTVAVGNTAMAPTTSGAQTPPASSSSSSSQGSFFGFFSSLFGGSGSKPIDVNVVSISLMSPISGLFHLFGFAGGGIPSVGVPALVGEEGPELFIPDVAGHVISAGKFGLSSSGVRASMSSVQSIVSGDNIFHVYGANSPRDAARQIAEHLKNSSPRYSPHAS